MLGFHIEDLNKEIPYEEGKIYWDNCKGCTSGLMKRLRRQGYYASRSGAVYSFRDKQGEELTTAYSWEYLLLNVAKIMR